MSHSYDGSQPVLDRVTFSVGDGELFALLGPNGSGKTTLFRLLTTLLPLQSGDVSLAETDLATQPDRIRHFLGVTFQSPSLDDRLTVGENLRVQGRLYGLSRSDLADRITELTDQFGLADRLGDRVESLSGGLKRRVEIAKGLLHRPRLLLLDEPTTGLDPTARRDVWDLLDQLRREFGVTVLAITHIMEEAERCDRLALLNEGKLVALGSPEELRSEIGGDCLTIEATDPERLAGQITDRFGLTPSSVGSRLRIETPLGHNLLRDLVLAFPEEIRSITLGKPTLDDVFFLKTGRSVE